MPRRRELYVVGSRYTTLVAYIARQDGDHVILTFAEIEAIIGVPLSVSAQVVQSIWSGSDQRIARDLTAIGWRAHLVVPGHLVEFERMR
jgi:hypothetical protein